MRQIFISVGLFLETRDAENPEFYHFYPRGASDARVLTVVVSVCVCVCLSVWHTPVLYQNG